MAVDIGCTAVTCVSARSHRGESIQRLGAYCLGLFLFARRYGCAAYAACWPAALCFIRRAYRTAVCKRCFLSPAVKERIAGRSARHILAQGAQLSGMGDGEGVTNSLCSGGNKRRRGGRKLALPRLPGSLPPASKIKGMLYGGADINARHGAAGPALVGRPYRYLVGHMDGSVARDRRREGVGCYLRELSLGSMAKWSSGRTEVMSVLFNSVHSVLLPRCRTTPYAAPYYNTILLPALLLSAALPLAENVIREAAVAPGVATCWKSGAYRIAVPNPRRPAGPSFCNGIHMVICVTVLWRLWTGGAEGDGSRVVASG